MKQLYYECFAGLSGDMNLGALIDLGADFEYLKTELTKLGLNDEFKITMQHADKHGIFGVKIDVEDLNVKHHEDAHEHNHEHYELPHEHAHEHNHEHHEHPHEHTREQHHHSHEHLRNFAEIKAIIKNSTLSKRVKKDSIGIFKLIAKAEGKVHNMPMEDVHFHEVGAIDSIVDIVGTAICMEHLNAKKIVCNCVELGNGFIDCAHGVMPIPAPATAELLLGMPVKQEIKGNEMTTPTGAAILKYYRDSTLEYNNQFAKKIGYGLGSRDLKIPNLVRVTLCNVKKN